MSGLDWILVFYDDFDVQRANTAFSPIYEWLQRFGLRIIDAHEPFYNHHPAIKQRLLGCLQASQWREYSKIPYISRDRSYAGGLLQM